MPRVKGTPRQRVVSLPPIFGSVDTNALPTSTATPEGLDVHSTTPHFFDSFALISNVMKADKFPIFPKTGAKINQVESEEPSSPPTLFFLPERVASQPVRGRDREMVTCCICDKSMRRGSLRAHIDRHESSGKFECELCGKNFSRSSAREKHIRTHTGDRPFKCGLCPKSYRQKVHLNEHMRSHSGERPFVCRLCGFSLASKSLLNRHLRTHGVINGVNNATDMWMRTDAPKLQVLAAAGAVGRSIDAKRHVINGSEGEEMEDPDTLHLTALNAVATVAALGRKHLCPECPAGFPTFQALRSHRVTTHSLIVEHVCETCGSTFSSKKLLKIHIRTTHPQICPLCEQVMPQRRRWILEVHIKEKHPGISSDSVIGPSPLAAAAALGGSRRTGMFRKKQAIGHHGLVHKILPVNATTANDSIGEDPAKLE